jgi:hypothetical protein
MQASLLQIGLPGGIEILVLLLLLFIMILVPAVVFYVVYRFVSGRTNYEARISELEREVESLRKELKDVSGEENVRGDVNAGDDANASGDETASEENVG